METKHRIAPVDRRVSPAQCVAPLLSRLLATLEPHLVPHDFVYLHAELPFGYVKPDEHAREITKLLDAFPKHIRVHKSETLRVLAESLEGDELLAVQIFTLAYCVDHSDVLRAWKPSIDDETQNLHLSLIHGIRKDPAARESFKTPMNFLLCSLLYYELHDRARLVFNILDCPFYFTHANAFVVLSLAHFEPDFVEDYKRAVAPFVHSKKAIDRAEELVRADPDLFVFALMTLPPRSPASARFERDVWPSGDPHPEAGRIMFAFASKWFLKCLHTLPWNLTPQELRRLYDLANLGWTPTLYETTYPFGSKT
jgi:hypothetical protein